MNLSYSILLSVVSVIALSPGIVHTNLRPIHLNPKQQLSRSMSIEIYEIQTAVMLINVHFRQLRQILRPLSLNQTFDSELFEETRYAVVSAIDEIKDLKSKAANHGPVDETLESIAHELACLDESKQCGNQIVCFWSEEKLDRCIHFPYKIYSNFAKRLLEESRRLAETLQDGCGPAEHQQKTFGRVKVHLNGSQQVLVVLKEVDTAKWAERSDLVDVLIMIQKSSAVLNIVEQDLNKCEKVYVLSILGGEKWPDNGNLTNLIDLKLQQIETSLSQLLNPGSMSMEEVNRERKKQRSSFLPVKYLLESDSTLYSHSMQMRVVSISYVLSFLI